jgi:hypothetical protein
VPNDLQQQLTECDKAAIHSVELVIEAMENLQVVLRRRVESLRRSIEFEEPAADYEKAVKDSHMTEEREDLQEALTVLEQRRRESRVAAFRSALDHGVSISDLARIWGFSRQMASRYAKEARGEIR